MIRDWMIGEGIDDWMIGKRQGADDLKIRRFVNWGKRCFSLGRMDGPMH